MVSLISDLQRARASPPSHDQAGGFALTTRCAATPRPRLMALSRTLGMPGPP